MQHHVAAKRYLCATDSGYYDQLSNASKHTLELQGGAMTSKELEAFAALPYRDDIVEVRLWDDQGKVAGVTTPDFAHYKPLLERLVWQHTGKPL